MRIAIGGIFHESNTFVARPTTLADYERGRLYRGQEMLGPLANTDTEIGGFLAAAAEWGFEPVPTFYAWAWPGGPLTSDCFRTLLDRLGASCEIAFLFNPTLTPTDLIKAINGEFGLSTFGDSRPELLDVLNTFLLEQNALGRRVLTSVLGPLPPGEHRRSLDLSALPSGPYLLRLQTTTGERTTRPVTVAR